ncbi:MAG TPA: DUF1173 family protein [Thiomonas arsenitoxydans]|jgi:hypothetical protein|uniref:DUF1173 family protein n=1 Tax=Thiomonas arsenitoxydans (strain DSM 22701 / CIP 110005 / 3As) TaxID=426114 RepID=UPI000BCD8647|nr:DUF1173 family protein [Thiomonas arsenitoxydans]OZB55554.1 MAG: hypothetical protein B7X43_00635 [Thiomonas sp. 15-63-373]OZB76387.1 MAG: hypothetical protein B7X36_03690 [Thiomonas sp. 14-64-326]HML83111.1 DUF1173 family protein [Thiomonas arsenitoxydans]
MSEYLFPTGEIIETTSPEFQGALADAYGDTSNRVRCLCKTGGLPMYIAKRGELYILKRMPNTAEEHAAGCDSYEPPAALSGRSEVLGGAIKHDDESGRDKLRFEFSLSRSQRPPISDSTQASSDSVRAEPNKLSFLGLLHYLWDQSGLVRWKPFGAVIRWEQVRERVLRAASGAEAKSRGLSDILYMPEQFDKDRHDAQEARRIGFFKRFEQKASSGYLLCIGELKEFSESRGAHKLTIKHAPGVAFLMDKVTAGRFGRRFKAEMASWAADEKTRLIAAMTCAIDGGIAHVVEITLMPVTHDWIPFDGPMEKQLLDVLMRQEREFIKSLRYNLAAGSPVASAILTDAGEQGVALFLPPEEPEARIAWAERIEGYSGPTWEWLGGDMPALPMRASEAE